MSDFSGDAALSLRIDNAIRALLDAPREPSALVALITGDDAPAFGASLDYLAALCSAGYRLHVLFSHSGQQVQAARQDDLNRRLPAAHLAPEPTFPRQCAALVLPALSSNSLAKIALGIRDNLAGELVYRALIRQIPVSVTLNREFTPGVLPAAALAQLHHYRQQAEQLGLRFITPSGGPAVARKALLTAHDIRLLVPDQALHITANTLITPAARDEIAGRRITLITHPREATCIWQK